MTSNFHDTDPPEIDEQRREIALFRYGLIADLVALEPHYRGLYALLEKKAEAAPLSPRKGGTIPGSLRRHVAAETLRGWLRSYRRCGFDALVPRVRADQGSARSIPPLVVDLLCQMKEDSPALSIPALLKKARADHAGVITDEVTLPESTVHRLLARRGLMRKKLGDPTSNDRRRFEHESAGDLWMSDVMYGPKIRHHAPHRDLGDETPADEWARTSDGVRLPSASLGDHFLAEQKRSVQKDRTVTLDGVAFEVDATLVGERVTLRFDPARKPDKRTMEVWHQGRRIETARRVDVLANCLVKRSSTTNDIQIIGHPSDIVDGMAMRDLVVDDGEDF